MLHFSIMQHSALLTQIFCFSVHIKVLKAAIYTKGLNLYSKQLRHNLQLKTDSVKDFITDISRKAVKIYWKKTELQFTYPIKLLVEAWSFTKNWL